MARPDTLPNAPVVGADDHIVNQNDQEQFDAVSGTTTVAASADNDEVVAPTEPIVVDETDYTAIQERAAETAEAAEEQFRKDEKFRLENPDVPLARPANPNVGGE